MRFLPAVFRWACGRRSPLVITALLLAVLMMVISARANARSNLRLPLLPPQWCPSRFEAASAAQRLVPAPASPAEDAAKQHLPAGSTAAFFATLSTSAAELVAAGGVHLVDSAAMLGEGSLFPRSGGGGVDLLSQYGLETSMIRLLQASPFLVGSAERAALHVVPQFATFEVHHCLYALNPIPHARLESCAANVTRDYLMPLIRAVQATPAYQRTRGADHVWIFPWDLAWELFPGVPEALAGNLFWGYTGPPQNLIPVPVTVRAALDAEAVERNALQGGHSPAAAAVGLAAAGRQSASACADLPPHRFLASFAGTVWPARVYSRGLRQDLLAAFPEARATETRVAVIDRHLEPAEYARLLRDSLFCLSPQGWTPWSQRLYSMISAGCVPVFFDMPGFNVQLPMPDLLDWDAMSITIPPGRHSEVADILGRIAPKDVCEMRSRIAAAAPLLLWSQSPHTVLLGALHGAWVAVKARAADAAKRL